MIVESIWVSIVNGSEYVALPESQIEELEKRLDAYYENPQAGSSWNIVKEKILSGN